MNERQIVEHIANMDPGAASEVDGDRYCFFCYTWIEYDTHAIGCAWVEAKRIVTQQLRGEK